MAKMESSLAKRQSRVSSWVKELRKNKVLFLMLLPSVVLTIVFCYVPMGGLVLAFKSYNYNLGVLKSPWVGFNNFKFFVQSGKLLSLTRNTVLYNATFIITGLFFKMFFAIIISEMITNRYKKFLQSLMILPNFLSWVIVGGMAYSLLNYEFGSINNLLESMGIARWDVYNSNTAWMFIFPIVNIWKGTGYGMIFYLAAIAGISPEFYEAAYIDGCGLIKKIRYIILPMIFPTMCILLLLELGGILKGNMDMFYQLVGNNSNLYATTDVIDTYVFRSLTKLKDYSVTTAAGLYQQVVGCALVLFVNFIVKRIDPDSAIF